jgi:GT2 family glycosyltransferase
MSLIAMAVYDTEENGRTAYTKETLYCLLSTIDLTQHQVVVIDNNSCQETKDILKQYNQFFTIITLSENIGTAKAINRGWKLRKGNEHLIKMDNDVVINYSNWVDEMEEYLEADPMIGILGLKRKDLMENPHRNDQWKTTLRMLPHKNGESWKIVEDADHIIGTCQMYNKALIKKIGGLIQPSIYGFDDTLSAIRCKLAGFKNSFIPHIDIDHIDTKENPYWQEKRILAQNDMAEFNRMKEELINGKLSIYNEL